MSLQVKRGFHTGSKTPALLQKPRVFCVSSQDTQDVLNPCCILSSLLVFESTKKKKMVREKEQKKNRHGEDRRKNIFVLAAGKNPNDLIFTSVAEKQFSQLLCY